jgi:hypothetical protein
LALIAYLNAIGVKTILRMAVVTNTAKYSHHTPLII